MKLAKLLSLSFLALASVYAIPASAQVDGPAKNEGKINQLIIYGDDACPESVGEDIVVCARMSEKERYRIPTSLRDDPNAPGKEAWTNRVKSYEYVGATGTMSCSAAGAGGFTGCGLKAIDTAYAEKKADPGIQFGRLIAEARKKRLSGIDAESADVEERTKAFEADRVAREAKEAAARAALEAKEDAADAEALPKPK